MHIYMGCDAVRFRLTASSKLFDDHRLIRNFKNAAYSYMSEVTVLQRDGLRPVITCRVAQS